MTTGHKKVSGSFSGARLAFLSRPTSLSQCALQTQPLGRALAPGFAAVRPATLHTSPQRRQFRFALWTIDFFAPIRRCLD
jgi:hypothetical protein